MDSLLHTLMEQDMTRLWTSAGWVMQHKDQAKLAFIISEYLMARTFSKCLSKSTCVWVPSP